MHRLLDDTSYNTDILFLSLDQDGKIKRCSPSVVALTHYSLAELTGRDWIETLVPLEHQKMAREGLADVIEGRINSWDHRSTLLRKDGESRHIQWSCTRSVEVDEDGPVILNIGIDITELSVSMQKAQRDHRKYKTLLDNLPQYIFHKDSDSTYLSCNQSFAEALGRRPDEIVGTDDHDYFPDTLAKRYRLDDARIIQEGSRLESIEEYEETRSGQTRSVKMIKTPIYDEAGNSEGLIGIFWDITDELEARHQLEETREMLANAEHIARIGSWKLDITKDKLLWSEGIFEIFEEDKESFEVSYEAFLEHVHPDDRDHVNEAYLISLKTQEPYRIEHRLKLADGRIKTVLEQCHTTFDDQGTPLVSIGTIQDISELKVVDQEIARQAALLRSVIDATPDLIFYKDYRGHDGSYMGCNQAFEALIDKKEEEIIDQDDFAIFGPELGRSIRFKDKEVLRSGKTKSDEAWVDYPDGRHVLLQTLRTPLVGLDGETIGLIGVSRDITSRWRSEQRISEQREALRHQANHDVLTGLPNRALLYDRLHKAISKSDRNHEHFALLFIDLDQFKQINDSFGHAKGDTVLKEVATRLDRLIRDEDTLSRLGGDEFVIIVEQLHQSQHASIMADKVLNALKEPIKDAQQRLYITTSIGISIFPQDGRNSEDLLKNADAAMYKAKELGRNNYQFYSAEMTKIAYERMLMESDLRRALNEEELVLFYQPKVDLERDRIDGFEVLLRWQHPKDGLVLPSKFLPVAEDNGMIIEIGEYVLEKAARQLKVWQDIYGDIGHLSLNISTKQLQHRDFYDRFITILRSNDCRPEDIRLEISEDYISRDPTRNIPLLKKFIEHGVKIAIDDFGKGYASLTLLRQLPIYRLKIDRTFIQGLPEDVALTKAILAMAKSLDLDVIAKGVETESQVDSLQSQGCNFVQGYLHGRPANAINTGELIRTRRLA